MKDALLKYLRDRCHNNNNNKNSLMFKLDQNLIHQGPNLYIKRLLAIYILVP